MRAFVGALVLFAAACNSILGVHDIHERDDTDAAVDAPTDVAPEPPGPVTGTAINTQYESPTRSLPSPVDLTGYVLQAYVTDSSATGFQVIDGTGNADATFAIPNVPSAPYYFVVVAPGDPVPHFYQTSSRTLDLGSNFLGRRDAPRASRSTVLSLHLTGMVPVAENDRLFVDSFATFNETQTNLGTDGATTLDENVEWLDMAGPLLSAARGDDLYVVHSQALQLTNQRIRTIVDTYTTRDVTMVDGQPITITGAFTPAAANKSYGFTLDLQGYLDGLEVTSHQSVTTTTRLRVGFTGASSQGAPLVDTNVTTLPGEGNPTVSMAYADPFPADWQRFIFNGPVINVTYAARGAARLAIASMNTFERRAAGSTFYSLGPLFAAPHAIKVNGVDATRAAAVGFDGVAPVSIAWAPVVGISHYIVVAYHLADNGVALSLVPIATFDTAGSSIKLPASLFIPGDSYVFGVSAVADASTNYVSGSVQRLGFPYARREQVTARLLFSSGCGNGAVDGAFEECDTSGVATATCNADCTTSRCGDAITNAAAGEACDDGEDSAACDDDCTAAVCGDGRINAVAKELCDDGNTATGDGCAANCQVEPGFTCISEPSFCTHNAPVQAATRSDHQRARIRAR